jgi:predicted 3-demethylubiquinone-9 3-methyltransferase (glyoxalase superfamily)
VQKIVTFLWFDDQAEEAVHLYTSLSRNSKIRSISRYGDGGPGAKGKVMSVTFQLEGQEFMALNGGPTFKFTSAISLFVNCESQKEIDELWEKLSDGGKKGKCGWLQDRYGLSWQIIPTILGDLLNGRDAEKARRTMKVMLKMRKIKIEELKDA